MANEKKTSRKKFRVAVSGSTVDGREISPVHLREAAENFNPDVYAASISAGAFWPDIVLRELRLAVRLPGRVTTSRLLHTATGAVAHVTRELEAWQQEQQAAGHQTLADVPAPVINGESVNLWHWRNAVYTATRALILERYRDADTTDKGDRRADALDIQTSDLWRDVSWAISDILCRPRIFAELC
ncbi:head completion/stabilization protein [Escherichia coli]|nr:head completion/stabilization protein [Escherichia coli]